MRAAGDIQLAATGARALKIEAKGVNDIVTDVDHRCEAAVVALLRHSHADHPILAEEGSGTTQTPIREGPLWVLDPLDGTKNYAHGLPRHACSLALVWDGVPVLGAVLSPAAGDTGELFFAARGEGATLNDRPIRVSRTARAADALVASALTVKNRPEPRQLARVTHLLGRTQAVRTLGCASLDLCDVACGRLDAYFEEGLSPWDTAAGTLIVSEAGGVLSTFGDSRPYSIFGNETLAATPAIATELRALVGEVG